MRYFLRTNNKLIFVIVRCDGDPILLKQIIVRQSSAISKLSLGSRIGRWFWPILSTIGLSVFALSS